MSEGFLSGNGLCLEGVMYGGGFVQGGFVRGGFVRRGFCLRTPCCSLVWPVLAEAPLTGVAFVYSNPVGSGLLSPPPLGQGSLECGLAKWLFMERGQV